MEEKKTPHPDGAPRAPDCQVTRRPRDLSHLFTHIKQLLPRDVHRLDAEALHVLAQGVSRPEGFFPRRTGHALEERSVSSQNRKNQRPGCGGCCAN